MGIIYGKITRRGIAAQAGGPSHAVIDCCPCDGGLMVISAVGCCGGPTSIEYVARRYGGCIQWLGYGEFAARAALRRIQMERP